MYVFVYVLYAGHHKPKPLLQNTQVCGASNVRKKAECVHLGKLSQYSSLYVPMIFRYCTVFFTYIGTWAFVAYIHVATQIHFNLATKWKFSYISVFMHRNHIILRFIPVKFLLHALELQNLEGVRNISAYFGGYMLLICCLFKQNNIIAESFVTNIKFCEP